MGVFHWTFSWHGQLGGDPCVDPEPAGEIIYLIWHHDPSEGAGKHEPFLERAPSRQFAHPFGGSVHGFRQRPANWGSVLVRRFSTSEGTLTSTSPAI